MYRRTSTPEAQSLWAWIRPARRDSLWVAEPALISIDRGVSAVPQLIPAAEKGHTSRSRPQHTATMPRITATGLRKLRVVSLTVVSSQGVESSPGNEVAQGVADAC